jgi:hypothetical protein
VKKDAGLLDACTQAFSEFALDELHRLIFLVPAPQLHQAFPVGCQFLPFLVIDIVRCVFSTGLYAEQSATVARGPLPGTAVKPPPLYTTLHSLPTKPLEQLGALAPPHWYNPRPMPS